MMDAETIISAIAVIIAVLSFLLTMYWRFYSIKRNEFRHVYQRINTIESDITEIRERLSGIERDVEWLKARVSSNTGYTSTGTKMDK